VLPSVRTNKEDTIKFINELKKYISLDSNKEKFLDLFQVEILKCEIMLKLKKIQVVENNLN
jgi:hypothetical protein